MKYEGVLESLLTASGEGYFGNYGGRFVAETLVEPLDELTPLKWLDNFAMRSFTNDQIFDDTLPVADGLIEIGSRVPIELLNDRLTDWFRRKGYLGATATLVLTEL